jgi:hypothetical protein
VAVVSTVHDGDPCGTRGQMILAQHGYTAEPAYLWIQDHGWSWRRLAEACSVHLPTGVVVGFDGS